jgi:hypothetical protein
MTKTVRQIALDVLKMNHLTNKVKARSTNFGCTRHNSTYIHVDILDWVPNPIAETVEEQIKTAGNAQGIGIMVGFKGAGFVQT